MTQFFFLTGSMSGLRLCRRHIHSSDTDYKQRRSHRGRHGGQCNKRTTHDGSGKVASDTRDLRETLEAVGDTSSASEDTVARLEANVTEATGHHKVLGVKLNATHVLM